MLIRMVTDTVILQTAQSFVDEQQEIISLIIQTVMMQIIELIQKHFGILMLIVMDMVM